MALLAYIYLAEGCIILFYFTFGLAFGGLFLLWRGERLEPWRTPLDILARAPGYGV